MPKSRFSPKYERLLKALRETRLSSKLTQVEVARHFGAHASFISKIESGERRIDVIELAELCRLYGVSITAFLKKAGLD
jgi:transcriptional regulator with XRE-family HTH domain